MDTGQHTLVLTSRGQTLKVVKLRDHTELSTCGQRVLYVLDQHLKPKPKRDIDIELISLPVEQVNDYPPKSVTRTWTLRHRS